MSAKSAISEFGVAVIFPDAVHNASGIINSLQTNAHAAVAILLEEKRKLTAEEACKVYQLTNIKQLAHVGGGFAPYHLKKGLQHYCERIKRMQEEEVVLIAFDNWCSYHSRLLQFVTSDAWVRKTRPAWDFDCVTGEDAKEFKYLFSPESWKKIEKKAQEFKEISVE